LLGFFGIPDKGCCMHGLDSDIKTAVESLNANAKSSNAMKFANFSKIVRESV